MSENNPKVSAEVKELAEKLWTNAMIFFEEKSPKLKSTVTWNNIKDDEKELFYRFAEVSINYMRYQVEPKP